MIFFCSTEYRIPRAFRGFFISVGYGVVYNKEVMFCLPSPLSHALWEHVQRELPNECVGMLGGKIRGQVWQAVTLYPLGNIAMRPEYEYLADPGHQLRALRSMTRQNLQLVGLYHSHPSGPSFPSHTDLQMATYAVPYLIANFKDRCLSAYILPEGKKVEITHL